MVIISGRKVLIAPVGTYEQRLWRAIGKAGADCVYLITESKSEYEITKTIAKNLEKQIKKAFPFESVETKEADFAAFDDIYRVFVGIIETERAIDPNVRVILDVTSTTKESTLVATNLASLYNLTISYVPGGVKKDSKELIEQRYHQLKDDMGSEYKEISLGLPGIGWSKFSAEEMKLLYEISQEKNNIDSVSTLIGKHLGVADLKTVDSADKKRVQRAVYSLEEKGLISGEEAGRAKTLELTEAGNGVILGIKEADAELRKRGKAGLIEGAQQVPNNP